VVIDLRTVRDEDDEVVARIVEAASAAGVLGRR
jgi:hypothetical protein